MFNLKKVAVVFVLKPSEYPQPTWPKKHADLPSSAKTLGFQFIMLRNVEKQNFSPPQVIETAAGTNAETNIQTTENDSTTFLNQFIRQLIERTSLKWTSAGAQIDTYTSTSLILISAILLRDEHTTY
jgi:hypothetical protein